MELGNFLGKLKGEKQSAPEQFLALILTDEVVQAAVWQVVNEVTEVVSIGTPVEWDGDTGTTSELVTAVDATISSATEGIEDEPTGIILGVPHSWTDKNGLLGVKREFIKTISKELELKTLGFVVITDSILSYLKMQEGTPTTSILIQVSRDELILVLVRLGRIEGVETIGRSDDVVTDVTEGIARFKVVDNLPSRLILFNSMHSLDDLIQNLLSVDWPAEFNFLHTPKIEALPKDIAIRALTVAGGTEVAKSLGFAISDPVKKTEAPVSPDVQDMPSPADSAAVAGGDSSTGDLAESQVGTPKVGGVSPLVDPDTDLLSAAEIGFSSVAPEPTPKLDFIDRDDEPEIDTPRTPVPTRKPMKLPRITLPHLHFQLPDIKRHWWIIGGGLLTLGVLIFWLVWVMPRATLTITVVPKDLDQAVDLTLSASDSSIDFVERIVPAELQVVSETGEKIAETTGKKTVGETATGEVTIYNRTSSPKTFPKGTQLSSGSLKFTLDSDVTVASKSAGSDYIDVPGKVTAKLTAGVIGQDSNLPSGTEFTIQNFGKDSYIAKNETALQGGSSEEVQVVSKDDQKNLVSDLIQDLLDQLKTRESTNSEPGTGVYLIGDSAKTEDVTYSAKIGEPAKNLTANLTLKVVLLKYKTEDVTTLVNSAIDQAVPEGYIRANLPSTVDLTASSVSEDNQTVKGNAQVKISLLPVIDSSLVKTAIKGKSTRAIEPILLQAIPGYLSTEVTLTPRFIPPRFISLPLNPNNLILKLTPSL